eukprot:5738220-Prymnesium_polylepis.1
MAAALVHILDGAAGVRRLQPHIVATHEGERPPRRRAAHRHVEQRCAMPLARARQQCPRARPRLLLARHRRRRRRRRRCCAVG